MGRKQKLRRLLNRRGQTSVEYLFLLSLVFITAYIILTGPLSRFTNSTFNNIESVLQNMVASGELDTGNVQVNGGTGTPMDQRRFRPVHL
jgi:uncharacterized protein (UPF0333 family)